MDYVKQCHNCNSNKECHLKIKFGNINNCLIHKPIIKYYGIEKIIDILGENKMNNFYIKALEFDLEKLKKENLELKNKNDKLQKDKEILLFEIGITEEDWDDE